MSWIYFTLLAVFLWSLSNMVDKHVLSKYIKNPTIWLIPASLSGLILTLCIPLFVKISIIPTNLLLLSLITGIVYAVSTWFYFKSISFEEVSRVVPLYSITSIFVLILATIFLVEIFTFEKYIGIFLIILGSILISLKRDVKFKISKALIFMIIGSLFYAIGIILLKFILNSTSYWNAFFWIRVVEYLVLLLVICFYYKPFIKIIKKYPITGFYGFTSEGLNLVAMLFLTIAFSVGYATLVSALSEIQPLVVLGIATLLSIFKPTLIREELKGSIILLKILAIGMTIIGSILII